MPTYEWECRNCLKVTERMFRVSECPDRSELPPPIKDWKGTPWITVKRKKDMLKEAMGD